MDTASAEHAVLHVTEDETTSERVVRALRDPSSPVVVTTATTVSAALDVLDDGSVDCVISDTAFEDEDWGTLLYRVREFDPSVPFVVYATFDGEESVESVLIDGADAALHRRDGERALAAQVGRLLSRLGARTQSGEPRDSGAGGDDDEAGLWGTRHDGRAVRRKIEALHGVATSFDRYHEENEIYQTAVMAAENILSFDMCFIGVEEDGDIYPRATNNRLLEADPVIMSVDEGVAGKTIRTGRTFLVDHPSEDPDAKPISNSIVSAISIPIDDFGVFQALSSETGRFTSTDIELAELLVSHVDGAVGRIRREEQLTHERDQFGALFRNVPEPAVQYELVDGELVVVAANPQFETTFGFDPERDTGVPLADVVRPTTTDEADVIERRLTEDHSLDVVVERRTATGRGTFFVRNAPVASDHDVTTGYVIYTDVSEMKRRERQLKRQNERLSEFASIVSHDLRNPLGVAQGYLDEVRDGDDDERLDEVATALSEMERFIGELLSLARQGQVVNDPAETSLASVVEAAWHNVETADATLEPPASGMIEADAERLQQLLENLFRNCVEHAGRAATVSVGFLGESGDFYVADDGPGIPEAKRESVFDSGYTDADDGTGIGLFVVRQVAEAHGWQVRIDEGRDGGARFTFVDVPGRTECGTESE